ncbi:hypothetical protein F-E9_400 [Faustovirus]|nr:hypothetical protein F-E9_400 [Faustovirus]
MYPTGYNQEYDARQIDRAVAKRLNETTTRFVNKLGIVCGHIGDLVRYIGATAFIVAHASHFVDYLCYRKYTGFPEKTWNLGTIDHSLITNPTYFKAQVDEVITLVIARHRSIVVAFAGSVACYFAGRLMRRFGRYLREREVNIW